MSLPIEPNWRNFKRACWLAERAGATTILLTGKGEPTLYPHLISDYLVQIQENGKFPFIELQTNGITLCNLKENLKTWYDLGLTTVSLSAVSTSVNVNREIYGENYPPIEESVALLHKIGFTVRLSIIMAKNYIYLPNQIEEVVDFCKVNRIKQLTLRPVSAPEKVSGEVYEWVSKHDLSYDEIRAINDYVNAVGHPVLHLTHGAIVYDFNGQNLCLANCLTTNDTDENMRQIIFWPDGSLSHSWQYPGAILL